MRKRIKQVFCALLVLMIVIPAIPVKAAAPYMSFGKSPYRSYGYWRLDEKGEKFGHFFMQTPYIPSISAPVLGNPLYDANQESVKGFEIPEDLYIDANDHLYVVDSRQNRAVKMTNTAELLVQYGDEEGPGQLKNPEGIYVADNLEVYVCDTGNNRIAIFTNDGVYLREILKPDDIRLQNILFLPERITIDTRGLYIILCRGVNQGLLMISPEGEFKGFFGANVTETTFLDKVKAWIYTYEQEKGTAKIAATVSDIFTDQEGYIYTATANLTKMQVKKYNIGSENLFRDRQMDVFPLTSNEREFMEGMKTNFTAVCADADGNVFALDSGSGRIFMFDRFGEPVFSFGQRMWDPVQITVGTLADPTSMRVDSNGILYVTDRVYKGVIVFTPTEYAQKLNNINYLYNDGRYADAEPFAQDVLRDNVFFDKANIVLGKYHFKNREWTDSMEYFKKAKNTTEYSEAFWEWRLTFIQKYFAYAVLVILILAFGFSIWNMVKKKLRKTGRAPS